MPLVAVLQINPLAVFPNRSRIEIGPVLVEQGEFRILPECGPADAGKQQKQPCAVVQERGEIHGDKRLGVTNLLHLLECRGLNSCPMRRLPVRSAELVYI